jgi:hypothetical protein
MSENLQGHIFDPVGCCIYCGCDGGAKGLRDEHIVPYSLNGNAILPRSICAECEGITSYIDGYLSRHVYYDIRLHTDAQSRTPKGKRPKTRSATVNIDGLRQTRTYPTGEHPFTLVLPLLGVPGFITRKTDVEFGMYKAHMFYYYPPGFEKQLSIEAERESKFWVKGEVNLTSFARGIAKIGYCHGIAQNYIDVDPDRPIARFIRGEDLSVGPYLVGCDLSRIDDPPSEVKVMHRVQLSYVNPETDRYLVSSVRLFSNTGYQDKGMPTYLVRLS